VSTFIAFFAEILKLKTFLLITIIFFENIQDEGVLLIMRLEDLALRIGPPQTARIFKDLIVRSLKAVHDGEAYPMLMGMHLSISSRMLLNFKCEFHEFTNEIANETNKNSDEIAGNTAGQF
jgi:hypothetical protein